MLRFAGILAAAFTAGCGPMELEPRPVSERVDLTSFEDCSALERFIEDRAVEEMRVELELLSQSGFEVSRPRAAPVATSRLVPHRDGAPVRPDVVLTTGDRLYVLGAGMLRAVRIAPLGQAVATSVEGAPRAVGMVGDHLFVVAEMDGISRITVFDPDNLEALATTALAGRVADLQYGSDDLRLLLEGGLTPPPPLSTDRAEALRGADALAAEQEARIRERGLSDWLPDRIDCSSAFGVTGSVRLGLTRLVRVSYRGELASATTTLIGQADATRFGNDGNALVALPHWWAIPRPGQAAHTYLFTLDAQAEPAAAGGLLGRVPFAGAAEVSGDRLRLMVAEEIRVPDITSTWGRTVRTYRAQELLRAADRWAPSRKSTSVAGESPLQAAHFDADRALASTAEGAYLLDLDAPGPPATRLDSSGAIAQIEPMAGRLLALIAGSGGTELGVIDLEARGRVPTEPVPAPALFGGLVIDFDVDSGSIALPAPRSGGPPAEGALQVRVLSPEASGELDLRAAIDFAELHAELSTPPRLLRTVFLEDRIIVVSDAGVQILTLDEPAALATLSFF